MVTSDFEHAAKIAIKNLRSGIHLELQKISKEHDLEDKIYSTETICGHLQHNLKVDHINLAIFAEEINEHLEEIKSFLMEKELFEISFKKEDEHRLKSKLKKDVHHQDWKIVHRDMSQEIDEEKVFINTEKEHLQELHQLFVKLQLFMNKEKLFLAMKKDNLDVRDYKDFVKKEEYYFMELFHFIDIHEHIFRNIVIKEELLVNQ